MATNRRSRRRERAPRLSPTAYAVMTDSDLPEDYDALERLALHPHSDAGRDLWRLHGAGIVARHAEAMPGTRPTWWWATEAPRWRTDDPRHLQCWYAQDGLLPEPRQRLGGSGVPASEVLAYVPSWPLGIPTRWCDVTPDDPPIFESQAAYLKRHGLLLDGEEARLPADAFEPEIVSIDVISARDA